MKRPKTLAGKLVLWQSVLLMVILATTWVALDRILDEGSPDGTSLRPTLAAGLLLAILAAGASVFIVSRLALRPLSRLQESLDRLSTGDLSVRVPTGGPKEMERLATALNDMAERLAKEIEASRSDRDTRDLVLSRMEEGVALVAPDGEIVFWNAPMERHIGSVPSTAAALTPASIRDAVDETRNTLTPTEVESEIGTPQRWLRASAVPAEGSVLLVVRDVTASRRRERVRSDFVANASHELKTPAATIRATAETLRVAAADDPAVVPRFAEQLEKEAVRLARIVSDLLDLSRLETGTSGFGEVDLAQVVGEAAELSAASAEDRGVRLVVETRTIPVQGSDQDLALMVRNLISNAINYTPEGGEVKVSLSPGEAGIAELVVKDEGIGIPSRDLDRIFERFYRVDRARSRETGGTGLGLSIVRHVAENHGGSVRVTSELGHGSTFTVQLPSSILQR